MPKRKARSGRQRHLKAHSCHCLVPMLVETERNTIISTYVRLVSIQSLVLVWNSYPPIKLASMLREQCSTILSSATVWCAFPLWTHLFLSNTSENPHNVTSLHYTRHFYTKWKLNTSYIQNWTISWKMCRFIHILSQCCVFNHSKSFICQVCIYQFADRHTLPHRMPHFLL